MKAIPSLVFAFSLLALTQFSYAGEDKIKKIAQSNVKAPASIQTTDDNFNPGPIGNDPIINPNPVSANNKLEVEVKAFPNPSTNGIFQLQTNEELSFTIADILGREISRGNTLVAQNLEINLSAEAKGIYFLKLKDGNRFKTLRLVKGV